MHSDSFESLTPHLTRIEQIQSNLPARVRFADARPELNLAVDAAANDWILILRERETVDEALASEIAGALNRAAPPSSAASLRAESGGVPQGGVWGYRIRTVPFYAGRPLHIHDEGELRLVHRRHLIRRGELAVEGAIVRMTNALHAVTFESIEDHRAYLEKRAVPHSTLRRVLIFLHNARTLDGNTLRYLWVEAGFDQGERR